MQYGLVLVKTAYIVLFGLLLYDLPLNPALLCPTLFYAGQCAVLISDQSRVVARTKLEIGLVTREKGRERAALSESRQCLPALSSRDTISAAVGRALISISALARNSDKRRNGHGNGYDGWTIDFQRAAVSDRAATAIEKAKHTQSSRLAKYTAGTRPD